MINERDLYQLAYRCAGLKVNNACNGICKQCAFNLKLYIADPEATLIHVKAAMDYTDKQQKIVAENKEGKKGCIIQLIVLIIALVIAIAAYAANIFIGIIVTIVLLCFVPAFFM
jgi:accessory gene regulator protein AgrB